MKKELHHINIHRCLKPSGFLYFCLALLVLVFCCLVFLFCTRYGYALIYAAFLGMTPLVLVEPVASYIAKRAEYKKTQANLWFSIDKQAEKTRYGPLRAKRRAIKYGGKR